MVWRPASVIHKLLKNRIKSVRHGTKYPLTRIYQPLLTPQERLLPRSCQCASVALMLLKNACHFFVAVLYELNAYAIKWYMTFFGCPLLCRLFPVLPLCTRKLDLMLFH